MSPPVSLRKNFLWTFVGNVFYAACQWGMLVIIAKLGTPEMVGQFSLGLAISAPILMLTNLQLRPIIATDAKHEYPFSIYLALRSLTAVLSFFAIVTISFLGGYSFELALIITGIGLAKSFEAISDLLYGLWQQHERMDLISLSMMLKGAISLAGLGTGIYLTGQVLWGIVGLALAWLTTLITYDRRHTILLLLSPLGGSGAPNRRDSLSLTLLVLEQSSLAGLKSMARLVWLALPLGLVMMLVSLNTNIPRYFIDHFYGERALGIYSALAYLMVAGNTIIQALGQSASPRLAKYYANADIEAFRRLLVKLLLLGLILGTLGVLIVIVGGKPLLRIIYRPEYAEQVQVLVWLMAAAGVYYLGSFLGYALTAVRVFRLQLVFNLAHTTLVLLGSYFLIPSHGLKGAAWAIGLGQLILLLPKASVIYAALGGRQPTAGAGRSKA